MTSMTSIRSVVPVAIVASALAIIPAPVRAQKPEPGQVKSGSQPSPAPRRGFNIVLLLGDMQAADAQDSIPASARKALSDMKDFLPYKSYRLLDTQWIIGGTSPALTRLRGVDDQEYDLELRAYPNSATGISVQFVLREPAGAPSGVTKGDPALSPSHPKDVAAANAYNAEVSRDLFQLERERVDLTARLVSDRQNVEIGMKNPEDVKRMEAQLGMIVQRISALKQMTTPGPFKATGRTVIDTAFRMEDGETVVVGSSGVKGGKRALIALLTAAPPTSSKKSDAK